VPTDGYTRLGILGTKYLTESDVYPEALAEFKIEREIPDAADRERINEIIFKEFGQLVCSSKRRGYTSTKSQRN